MTKRIIKKEQNNILIFPSWVKLLKELEHKNNLHRVCIDMPMTHSYATKVVNQLQERGLLTRELKGRVKEITLTAKGKEIAYHYCKIIENLK